MDLNHGPLDLQSNALPLSYTPDYENSIFIHIIIYIHVQGGHWEFQIGVANWVLGF